MTAHNHTVLTPGCFRCDLNRDEVEAAQRDARIETRALREMAQDFRNIGMTEAAELCDEKAESEGATL